MKTALSLLLLLAVAYPCVAQEEDEVPVRPSRSGETSQFEAARTVYDSLVERWSTGDLRGVEAIESIERWSQKLALAEGRLVGRTRQGGERDAYAKHWERMQDLAKRVEVRAVTGRLSTAERAAARYVALSAERVRMVPIEEAIEDTGATIELEVPIEEVEVEGPIVEAFEIEKLNNSLPGVSVANPLTAVKPALHIRIDREGRISVQGSMVPERELANVLRAARRSKAQLNRVEIAADLDTRFVHVVKVMTICRAAGISDVDIAALDRPKSGGTRDDDVDRGPDE